MGYGSENSRDSRQTVTVRAYSPDSHPILVLELDSGELRAAYHETGYDLERAKPVSEEWLRENAVGRHSFVEANPLRRMSAGELGDYARSDLGA